jgi:hypothetical protein
LVALLARYVCLLLAACWLAGFACYRVVLPALPACWLLFCQFCLPTIYSRLLVGWFCLLCMTDYRGAFLACLLVALLVSYA